VLTTIQPRPSLRCKRKSRHRELRAVRGMVGHAVTLCLRCHLAYDYASSRSGGPSRSICSATPGTDPPRHDLYTRQAEASLLPDPRHRIIAPGASRYSPSAPSAVRTDYLRCDVALREALSALGEDAPPRRGLPHDFEIHHEADKLAQNVANLTCAMGHPDCYSFEALRRGPIR